MGVATELVMLKKAEMISFTPSLTFILAIVNFLIFVLLMRHFFFNKVKAVLEKRKMMIQDEMDAAQNQRKKAMELQALYDRKMEKAEAEGSKILHEKLQLGKDRANEIIKDANEEAQRIKTRAKREIEREQIKAKDELKKELGDLVIATTGVLLGKEISKEDHHDLIMESIDKIGDHTWRN